MADEAKFDDSITFRCSSTLKEELQAFCTGLGAGVSFKIRELIIAADVGISGETIDTVDSG